MFKAYCVVFSIGLSVLVDPSVFPEVYLLKIRSQ